MIGMKCGGVGCQESTVGFGTDHGSSLIGQLGNTGSEHGISLLAMIFIGYQVVRTSNIDFSEYNLNDNNNNNP